MEKHLLDTYAQLPFEVTRGEGVYIYDAQGRQYLDLYGGHAVAILGHSPQPVADAIYQQANRIFFYSNVAPMKLREEVASELVEFSQSGLHGAFFCNSGAEANENALKLAIQKTGRSKLIALKESFHGRTLLASFMTDNPGWHKPFLKWQGENVFIQANNLEQINQIDQETAAIIVEPIQSMAGVVELSSEYLLALRKRCDQVGALLIFDEVQTSMGRTGTPFISGACGIVPDMLTTAKGLASGFPVGVLLLSKAFSGQIKTGDLGSTFGANPMAMAAIRATIKVIKENNLVAQAKDFGDYAKTKLQHNALVKVRGKGCILGLEFSKAAKPVYQELLSKGIISGTSHDPSVLRLLPPIIVERKHLDQLQAALTSII